MESTGKYVRIEPSRLERWRVLEGAGGCWRVLEGAGGCWKVLALTGITLNLRLQFDGMMLWME